MRLTRWAVILILLSTGGSIAEERGIASFYGKERHGRKTASGEVFSMWRLTAAHERWPFGTIVRVTRVDNGKSVVVRINDRGPGVPGRIIDLSMYAGTKLKMYKEGLAQVKCEWIGFKTQTETRTGRRRRG